MWLRDRSFDLRQEVQLIRSAATPAQRRALVTQLEQRAVADQMELANLVTANGGTVLQHYWVLSMLAVEVPPAALPLLRAHRRVLRLVPVRCRGEGEVALAADTAVMPPLPLPIATSTDSNNHCVAAARAILGGGPSSYGDGVRVAVFDSGIDSDSAGSNTPPALHPSFLQPPPNQTLSRIDVHLRAGQVDCNNIGASGGYRTPPFAYRPCRHSTSALHGTAMAGIIAGNADASLGYVDGHVPHARIVDVSITDPDPNPLADVAGKWEVKESAMLLAIQMLRSQILEDGYPVHVLNISYDGWPNPADPVPSALDDLAISEDILVVSIAGNYPDETRFSNGSFNALAVGSVHARESASAPFIPMQSTATGPLNSDWNRLYPDVCATGAGIGVLYGDTVVPPPGTNPPPTLASCLQMPMVDIGDACSVSGAYSSGGCVPMGLGCTGTPGSPYGLPVPPGPVRYAFGTSEAAAQVSGAAALYRSARPSANAEETRAAILLNVLSPFTGTYTGGTGQDIHAYKARNTFGVGYVRDDLLAEFAARLAAIQPLHTVVTLTPANATAWVSYPPTGTMADGGRYAFAICWPRPTSEAGSVCLADVDLEIWDSDANPTVCFARSTTSANNYERLALPPDVNSNGRVFLKISAASFSCANDAVVTVVGRQFEPDLDHATPGFQATPVHAGTGTIQSLGAGSNCTSTTAVNLSVARAVPIDYADAWGSAALNAVWLSGQGQPQQWTLPTFRGVGFTADATNGPGQSSMHIEIRSGVANDHVGPSMSIGGIAFRMWRPFAGSGPLTVNWVKMAQTPAAPVTTTSLLQTAPALSDPVLGSGILQLANDIVPATFDTWPLVIPFTQPFQLYAGSNLHIWIQLGGTPPGYFEVDGADDGVGDYGMVWGVYGGGLGRPVAQVGVSPIIGLIPPLVSAPLPPKLEAYGEPWVGRSLELRLSQAPPQSVPYNNLWFLVGTWSPGTQVPCAQHVVNGTSYWTNSDQIGRGRMTLPIPTVPAMLHMDYGIQAVVQTGATTFLLSNALRVTIRGAL